MSKSLWLRALHTTRRSFDEGARSELFLAVLRSPYHSLTRVHVLAYAFAAQQGILEVKPVFHTAPLCSSKCLFAPSAMSCCLQEEMQREAHSIVAERRGPEISALRTEDGWDGVFAWAGGPPRAGQRALLAYNKACGAIRCSSAGSIISTISLHGHGHRATLGCGIPEGHKRGGDSI